MGKGAGVGTWKWASALQLRYRAHGRLDPVALPPRARGTGSPVLAGQLIVPLSMTIDMYLEHRDSYEEISASRTS